MKNHPGSSTHRLSKVRVLSWLPEVDLSGLSAEEKEQAKRLLFEEAEAFSRSDDDVGCISELEIDLKLTSDQPVPFHTSSTIP